MNKKGEELISNFFGYLFLVILTILFFVLIVGLGNKTAERTAEAATIENAKTDLLMLLREPITFPKTNGREYSVSELLAEAEYDSVKLEAVENRTTDRLSSKYFAYYNLEVQSDILNEEWPERPPGHTTRSISEGTGLGNPQISISKPPSVQTQVIIPGYDGSISIILKIGD